MPHLIDIDASQLRTLPVRDRIGAFKILAEFLLALKNSNNEEDDNRVEIVVSIQDFSIPEVSDEG